jgi:sulfonate transport system substrate-binding protein
MPEAAMSLFTSFLASFVSAVVLSTAAAGAHADDAYPKEIRIAIQKGGGIVALRASGNLEKAFAPHHVAVKWLEFIYGPPMVEGINAGAVDVGYVGATPPILAQAGSAPEVVYVAYTPSMQGSYGIVVPKDSAIHDVKDLKGKKVAVAKGSQGHLFAIKALEDAGMKATDAQIVYLDYSDARTAFARGDIDAWVVPDPRYADVELATGARTILTIGKVSVPQYGFYIATRSFAEKYPAALRLLFDELAKQDAYNAAHPDAVAQLLSKDTGVSLDVWHRVVPRNEWGVHYPLSADVLKAQQDAADLAHRNRIIPRAVDVRQAVVDIQ